MRPIDLFGEGAEFDHVGLVVESIDAIAPDAARASDPLQDVTVAFFEFHGLPVEAISPNSERSPVSRQLKNGQKLLHLCYRVRDLKAACENAKKYGLFQISAPVSAKAFEGRNIVWLYGKVLGLFELTEQPGSASLSLDEDT